METVDLQNQLCRCKSYTLCMPQLEVTTYNVQYWWGIIILFLLLILLEVFVFPLIKRSWSIRTFLMK